MAMTQTWTWTDNLQYWVMLSFFYLQLFFLLTVLSKSFFKDLVIDNKTTVTT